MGGAPPNASLRSENASLRPVEALRQSYKTLANDPLLRNSSSGFPAAEALRRDKMLSTGSLSFNTAPALAFVPAISSAQGPFQMVPSEPAASLLLNPPGPSGSFCFIETPGPSAASSSLPVAEQADTRHNSFADASWVIPQTSNQPQVFTPRTQPSALVSKHRTNLVKPGKALQQAPSKKDLLPQANEQPLLFLQNLLERVSRLDSDRFFEYPVTEEQAPGYHKIIKRPMCFQKMREKLNDREYKTWKSFVDDFELICTNAMQYNQKRSRIHRAALTMLRQGKKILVESELQGRRAVAILHPGGVAAAAVDEQKEAQQTAQKAVANALAKTAAKVVDEPFRTQSVAETRTTSDTEDLALGYASSDEEQYSSFSGTDLSEDEQPFNTFPTRTLEEVKQPVCFQPFEVQQFKDYIDKRVPVKTSTGKDAAWKSDATQLEFRCRWLELRMRDLAEEASMYSQRLHSVLSCGPKPTQDAHADNEDAPPVLAVSRKLKHRNSRAQITEFQHHEHVPFFAEHARIGRRKEDLPKRADNQERAERVELSSDEKCYPARVYATVELVERQLTALRKHLHQIPHLQPVPAAARGTARTSGRGGRAGRALKRVASHGRGSSHAKAVHRSESLASLGKRKRTEYDLHDVVAPVKILAPKLVDKLQVAAITTPPFRLINEEELKRREAVITALAWNIKLPGVQAALPSEAAALVEDEGSSSEDTSDEAYLRRHYNREKDEKDLYAAAASGGAKKKSSNTSKKPRASQAAPSSSLKCPPTAPSQPDALRQLMSLDSTDSVLETPFTTAGAGPDIPTGLPTLAIRGKTGRGRTAEGSRGPTAGRARGRPPGFGTGGGRAGRGSRLGRGARGTLAAGRPPLAGRGKGRGSKSIPEQAAALIPAAISQPSVQPTPPNTAAAVVLPPPAPALVPPTSQPHVTSPPAVAPPQIVLSTAVPQNPAAPEASTPSLTTPTLVLQP